MTNVRSPSSVPFVGWTALAPRVFTSQETPPETDFSGYGFEGRDLVIGQSGLSAFERARERFFTGTDDGCYLICDIHEGKHRIRTDPAGMCKLFVYQSRSGWAVSNSFAALMDSVCAKNWPITPHYGVLDGWTLPPNVFGSCFTKATAVREITLLNSEQYIEIGADGLRIAARSSTKTVPDYERDITTFLELWLGRILGIMQSHHIDLSVELTGGLDSRTVFAFLLHLRERGILPTLDDIHVFCAQNSTADYRVAQALGRTYDVALERPHAGPVRRWSAADRFAAWRLYSLGMYSPPYFPPVQISPQTLTLGGHGGERHRAFTKPASIPDSILNHADKFRRYGRFRAMQAMWAETVDDFDLTQTKHPEFEILRHFWFRFHHSHMAQYSLRTPPLMSIHLDRCLQGLAADQSDHGFLLYDIMQRLLPGLATQAYDSPEKSPPAGRMSEYGQPFAGSIQPGEVFAGPHDAIDGASANRPAQDAKDSPIDYLLEVSEAYLRAPMRDALSPAVLDNAKTTLKDIAQTRALPDYVAFQPVHAMLLSDLIAKGHVPVWARSCETALLGLKRAKDMFR